MPRLLFFLFFLVAAVYADEPLNEKALQGQNSPCIYIGLDDEVLKTSMTVYVPLRRIEKDFLQDENAAKEYEKLFESLHVVAVCPTSSHRLLPRIGRAQEAGRKIKIQVDDAKTPPPLFQPLGTAAEQGPNRIPARSPQILTANKRKRLTATRSCGAPRKAVLEYDTKSGGRIEN